MTKRMLVDATHPEETRVVVLDHDQLTDFDFETSTKKQLKGNVYLAKVTRVEPSLQAAFVDYGGNRHGFLAFSEIHPDYYQIPQADREMLEKLERDNARAHKEADEARAAADAVQAAIDEAENGDAAIEGDAVDGAEEEDSRAADGDETGEDAADDPAAQAHPDESAANGDGRRANGDDGHDDDAASAAPGRMRREAQVSDDADEEAAEVMGEQARLRAKLLRSYKIQEVIKRRQILLVQVVKEERGTKGAALTTYLSLAGRYCVLMPNTPRGGGISRKIVNVVDRRRLKSIVHDMDVPDGMGLIVRTAGAQRSKAEIRRDYDYLLRQWSDIRETTLQSVAPAEIYAEGDLIKRAMRDLYSRDIDEVLVEGDEGHKVAKRLMTMMMPSRARHVKLYKDDLPLFYRYKVEDQLDAMHSPTVQLPSGGSIVIHTTEALTAIDVNSGRSTRERHIDETALKTNLEAADEAARQLRLRDLAGLIVIDFIDMGEMRHQRQVERRFREALKVDRARLQVGKISMFGLLELSRQRLRASLQELSSQPCPTCSGLGVVRSTESCALQALRMVQEEGIKNEASKLHLTLPVDVGLYLLNAKREDVVRLEQRYAMKVVVTVDDELHAPTIEIETVERRDTEDGGEQRPPARGRTAEAASSVRGADTARGRRDADTPEDERADAAADGSNGDAGSEPARASTTDGDDDENRSRRRRRRRRRGRRGESNGEAEATGRESNGRETNRDRAARDRRSEDQGRHEANGSDPGEDHLGAVSADDQYAVAADADGDDAADRGGADGREHTASDDTAQDARAENGAAGETRRRRRRGRRGGARGEAGPAAEDATTFDTGDRSDAGPEAPAAASSDDRPADVLEAAAAEPVKPVRRRRRRTTDETGDDKGGETADEILGKAAGGAPVADDAPQPDDAALEALLPPSEERLAPAPAEADHVEQPVAGQSVMAQEASSGEAPRVEASSSRAGSGAAATADDENGYEPAGRSPRAESGRDDSEHEPATVEEDDRPVRQGWWSRWVR